MRARLLIEQQRNATLYSCFCTHFIWLFSFFDVRCPVFKNKEKICKSFSFLPDLYRGYSVCFFNEENFKYGSSLLVLFYAGAFLLIHLLAFIITRVFKYFTKSKKN